MDIQQPENSLPRQIAMVTITLMAIGVVFVFSASANVTENIELKKFYEYTSLRQLLFFPLAILVMYVISCIDYRCLGMNRGLLKSLSTYFLFVSVILLILVLIPGLGSQVNFARRWLHIPLGPIKISFQPSELAKWTVIFFLAGFSCRYREELGLFLNGFVPLCLGIGIIVGLVLIEDFGTAAFIALITFFMFIMAGVKLNYILTPLPFAAGGFYTAIRISPERCQRILAFLHPDKWTDSINYQPNQSLIAIGSGGLWGKGLGMGVSKYGHLPEDTTDFIFSVIAEELGFIGTVSVILLFVVFICLGVTVALGCKDPLGKLIAAAITLAVALQAALNIGVVTVVLPTKGIPLPFISAGGTSLLLSSAAIGVLINIAKHSGNDTIGELG